MCFHACRCICWVYLHVCLNSIYGKIKEASRPAASSSNWHVNHVSVGWISVCVFVKDPWFISRGNVWPRESCPPHHPALTLPWREDGVPLSRREIGSQESESQNYHMSLSPNKTLQHVCGNEEPCFCVRVICQWPPPTSLLTWLSVPFLLMFGCFLLFLSTPRCTLEGNMEKKRNPTLSLPWGPLLVMAEWPHRGGCRVTRAGKISNTKTRKDRNVKNKRVKGKKKWRKNVKKCTKLRSLPRLDWKECVGQSRSTLLLNVNASVGRQRDDRSKELMIVCQPNIDQHEFTVNCFKLLHFFVLLETQTVFSLEFLFLYTAKNSLPSHFDM